MVQEIFEKLDNLPTLPSVAGALMRLAAEEGVQVEDVTRVIEADPSASARLLKIVNSAYRGLQGKVSSVSRAVVMLGVNGVRNVLLSTEVFNIFGDTAREKNTELFELWKHCLAVGSAAELLAENTGGVLPEDSFTAGLIHDIGKIALYSVAPDDYRKVLDAVEAGTEISEAEKRIFGISHAAAGRHLAEKWLLPDAIVHSIYRHHSLADLKDYTNQVDLTVAIVAVADDIVRRQRIGFSGTPESWEPLEEVVKLIGLDEDNIQDVLSHLVERISLRGAILEIELPESQLFLESLQKANSLLGRITEELQEARFTLEKSGRRLQAITDLNAQLGASFSPSEALSGLAVAVYENLLPKKVITYCLEETTHNLVGCVKSGSAEPKSFYISALKGAKNDVAGLGSDREAVVHMVKELSGKLDLQTGPGSLVGGRLFYVPVFAAHGQRAGMLLESAARRPISADDLRFFGEAATLFIERARLETRLRLESEKLMDSNRRSRSFYEELLNAKKLASIGRMAAGAAHEINNPLAIVSGRVQLLLKMEDNEAKKRHLDMIRTQCDRMSRIISDILTFAKPEKPVLAEVSVASVVDAALSLVEANATARDVRFVKNFEEGLPALAADSAKLEQAFRNILANAVDASNVSGEITIGVKQVEKDKFLAVTFADKGKGMDKEVLANIFEPFYTTKEGSGTGLGLSICHSIVAAHGGKLRVKSTQGTGTVFTVLLPVWRG